MKKTTLSIFIFILSFVLSAQTTTGTITLSSNIGYTAQIDVGLSLVTLTLDGPFNGYLGLGFGVTNMNNNADCVIYIQGAGGANPMLRDSSFNGNTSTPSQDPQQDWMITENTVTGSTRHLVATRVLDTGNTDDFVFTTALTSITLAWAHSSNSFSLGYHGGGTRGATTVSFTTLSNPDFQASRKFSIYPNPSSNVMNINIPALTKEGLNIEVFDVLGKKVYSQEISKLSSKVNIEKWNSGLYLVRLSSPNQDITLTKRFVKL